MIKSIGIDVVDVKRFSRSVERWGDRFLTRILTNNEISYCKKKASANESMAVRFAAKEAAFKCLPPSLQGGFRWRNVEVVISKRGNPGLCFSGNLQSLLHNHRAHLSLSHIGDIAVAVVVVETFEKE